MKPLDRIIIIAKTLASSVVWGLGQLLNRQWAKALFFVLPMLLLIAIEFITPVIERDPLDDSFENISFRYHYLEEFDFYASISGDELRSETSKGYVQDYYYGLVFDNAYEDLSLLHHVAELNELTFDEDELVFKNQEGNEVAVESRHLQFTPEQMYAYLGERLRLLDDEIDLSEYEVLADQDALESVSNLADRAYREAVRREFNTDTTMPEKIETHITEAITEHLEQTQDLSPEDEEFQETFDAYYDENYVVLRQNAEDALFQDLLEELEESLYPTVFNRQRRLYYNNYYAQALNTYYSQVLLAEDDFKAFEATLQNGLASGRDQYSTDDYNKMLLRLYFSYRPDRFEYYNNEFDNFFYNNTGFFVKGLWGVSTLGQTPQRTIHTHTAYSFFLPSSPTQTFEARSIEMAGHHSTQLLLRGIISTLLLVYFIMIYIWNLRDAYKTAKILRTEKKAPSQKQYFKDVYEDSFEYIVLMPALFLITFISIMPILFGMFVAFTNYNNEHIPPGQLISWVGFDNFKLIFTLSRDGGMPFGQMFFRVFGWTVVWAISATATCFFGGFLQAVILNNKRVVFRKAWRGLLILPWAVPALISQMIFRIMFAETGYINSVLSNTFVYDLLHRFGMLGRPFAEAGTGITRLLYFGNNNIQWITNEANPWFVRIFIILLNVWLGFPFFMALMSGVMTSIDKSLYEAASIDGATPYQQFKFITMPLVLFATSPLLIMTFAGNFNNFGVIYFITGGGPGGSFSTAYAGQTDILISWIYKLTTDDNIRWYSMASVFSILIFLIIGTISAWNFTRTRAFKEGD